MNDDEYDAVRLDSAKRPMWLVKVPPRVAKIWDSVLAKENERLGRIGVVAAGNGNVEKLTFHLDESVVPEGVENPALVAKDFDLKLIQNVTNEKDRAPPFRIFSRGNGGVEMEGIVENAFNLQPSSSNSYERTVKVRVKKETQKVRATKEMDSFELLRSESQKKPLTVKVSGDSSGLSRDMSDRLSKRRRTGGDLTEQGLREIIFSMYQHNPENPGQVVAFTRKEIKRAASEAAASLGKGFPVAMLDKMIKLLLKFHTDGRDGVSARSYELRPEYRVLQ